MRAPAGVSPAQVGPALLPRARGYSGQFSGNGCPTAALRVRSASAALIAPLVSTSHAHGAHRLLPTAVRRMKSASLAFGVSSRVDGAPHTHVEARNASTLPSSFSPRG